MEEIQKKKGNIGLIFLVVFLIIIILGIIGFGYYEYQKFNKKYDSLSEKYDQLNNNYKQIKNDYDNAKTELEKSKKNVKEDTAKNSDTNTSVVNDFKLDSSDNSGGYGTVTVTGYPEVKFISGYHTSIDVDRYYIYFHIISGGNSDFLKFINDNSNINLAKEGAIGLGCKKNNVIIYENRSKKLGFEEFKLSLDESNKILDSSKNNPVTLKLERLKESMEGYGPSACQSLITHISVVK